MRKLLLILLVAACSNKSFAQVIHVPTEQPTIQDGLNAASFGDTILVAPGTYFENIIWPNVNGIKLIAEGDTSNTFIDGNYNHGVIYVHGHSIDTLTHIQGFTIQHGRRVGLTPSGSGILCDSASIYIDQCRVTKNTGSFGAGIALINSFSSIRNSSIDRNSDSGSNVFGTGIHVSRSSIVLVHSSKITDNLADTCTDAGGVGIRLVDHADLTLRECEISRNSAIIGPDFGESGGIGISSYFSSS
ncbi:MAG: right-handed parallel beta-helix repeat-containing protein, partial [Flavobacteriales bacterium]|nr:right-handed parallel beta-helix repeat-containing protein [Flavobacteriales bacterium]